MQLTLERLTWSFSLEISASFIWFYERSLAFSLEKWGDLECSPKRSFREDSSLESLGTHFLSSSSLISFYCSLILFWSLIFFAGSHRATKFFVIIINLAIYWFFFLISLSLTWGSSLWVHCSFCALLAATNLVISFFIAVISMSFSVVVRRHADSLPCPLSMVFRICFSIFKCFSSIFLENLPSFWANKLL